MWYIVIGVTICIIIIIVLIKIISTKKIINTITTSASNKNYQVLKSNSSLYNLILENDTEIIYLRYITIPKNSSITVNSKSTWCLRYGGGNRAGRSYPNKEYLNYLTPFLNKEFTHPKKKVRKVVVLYPTTEVILKYVNESDIINLTQNDIVYGTQIIKFNELENYLF